MSGLAMPDETELPPGPRREFVRALRRLYLEAGKPTLARLAHPQARHDQGPLLTEGW